jgi:hypothetical protein
MTTPAEDGSSGTIEGPSPQFDVGSDYGGWPQDALAFFLPRPRKWWAPSPSSSIGASETDKVRPPSDLPSMREVRSFSDLAFDVSDGFAREQQKFAHGLKRALEATRERLRELKTDAKSEGHPISMESEKDLIAFLKSVAFTRRPFISLLDNGNLRAVWKIEGEQIGIQFRGAGEVQFVLFAKRPETRFVARSSGRDTIWDIARQIEAYGLKRLMIA